MDTVPEGAALPVEAALWYFRGEWIVLPRAGAEAPTSLPPLVWTAAPELLEEAQIEGRERLRLSDGRRVGFRIAPPHPGNELYVDGSTFDFWTGRPLRVRGTVEPAPPQGGDRGAVLVARTVWPEDARIPWRELELRPLRQIPDEGRSETLGNLVEAQAPRWPHARLLWERGTTDPPSASGPGTEGRDWADLPVLALVLSGAQGDDPGAEAGHVAVATGRLGPNGEWADWLVNNIYPLEDLGTKRIDSGPVPMDNYLTDLNSGQAFYRPVYVLVAVLRSPKVPLAIQQAFHRFYPRYWCHELVFRPARHNSTEMSLDVLREVGWKVPKVGGTSWWKGIVAAIGTAVVTFDGQLVRRAWSYFTEERTDLLPRVAFEVAGRDLLDLVEEPLPRAPTGVEERLREETEAVLFLRFPQVPSARPFGSYPVESIRGYRTRVGLGDAKLGDGNGDPARPLPRSLQRSCRKQGFHPLTD